MKNKSAKEKKIFSKFLAKIVRKFGFEIIDQSTLEIPSNEKIANENLSESGKKSITVPLGTTKITNKINSLTIIIRSYTFGDIDKNQVMITDDKSNQENLSRINEILKITDLETKIINLNDNEFVNEISPTDVNGEKISKNMISNMRNILKSIQITETDNSDLFYFLEDDYIHTRDAITEMLFTYEKISSQLNKEIFLCPADYPYLYSTIENTKLFFGNMRHWRTVNETLITFLTSKKMIIKYLDKLKLMGSKRHHPMELILHKIYEKEYCFSPIPSLAMHATNINTIYGLPPNFDWKKIWEENTP